jgi:hypothetical protein
MVRYYDLIPSNQAKEIEIVSYSVKVTHVRHFIQYFLNSEHLIESYWKHMDKIFRN